MSIRIVDKKILFFCDSCSKTKSFDLENSNARIIDLNLKCNSWLENKTNDLRLDFCCENCKTKYFLKKENENKEILDDEFRCEEFDDNKNYTNFGIYHMFLKHGIEKTLLEKAINLNKIRNPKLALLMKKTTENLVELEMYLEETISKQ